MAEAAVKTSKPAGSDAPAPERELTDGFHLVIDVLGPTGEILSVPEYDVRVYDREHPRGRTMPMPMCSFLDDFVRPLTAPDREQRLAMLGIR